ncbi:MAG: cell division protein SepF [Candidatus Thorarchaeota archaeon]
MRFSLRRRTTDDTSTEATSDSRTYPGLGLFSPAMDTCQDDPTTDCKKLAQLQEVFIRSRKLESLEDVSYVVNQVRDGTIVLLDITTLNNNRDQGRLELKRIIERIRGETRCFRADIALVNDNCVIVTPSFVRMGS